MPRGQSPSLKCPHAGCASRATGPFQEHIHGRIKPIIALGKVRERRYVHGHKTGLPDSCHQWLMFCKHCGRVFWSRHPEAQRRHDLMLGKSTIEEANQ